MNDIRPVVLSGGSGTRLWPLSNKATPKQFLELIDPESLFTKTVERLMAIPGSIRPLIVTGRGHLTTVLEELGQRDAVIVVEPDGRNTAAAVLAAALISPAQDVLVVSPSDHVVADQPMFVESVVNAVSLARDGGLVTLGVVPDRPETGFGYIRRGNPTGPGFEIETFVEKPSQAEATAMIADDSYLWNAGLFVGIAAVFLEQAKLHCPDLLGSVERAMPRNDGGVIHLSDAFLEVAAMPFDKAVMEVTDNGFVVPLDAGWSDVGSWRAVWELSPRDADGNAISGNAQVVHTANSYVRATSRPVAVLGLENVAVVETADGVVVTALDRAQDLRHLVDRFPTEDLGGHNG